MSGWIKLHRSIQDSFYWNDEAFSKGQAWIDLLILANHKAGIVRTRSGVVDVPRGSLAWSKEKLAVRWKWSRGKVLRFLAELCKQLMIVQRTVQRITIVSICKYEEYQGEGQDSDTTNGTTNGTTDGTMDGTMGGTVTRRLRKKEVKKRDIGAAPSAPPEFQMILNDKSFHDITTTDISRWETLYPAVDVRAQIRKMLGWLEGNPAKRKTKSGVVRFITTWLGREQDKGGASGSNNKQNQNTGFPEISEDFDLPEGYGFYEHEQVGGNNAGQANGNEDPNAIDGKFTCMEASHA